jgi:catechol 2,3-dioxygenase-like lactoylglutathione lyase family enzyme
MPRIDHVLETTLYVDDLERAVTFYRDVLGLSVVDTGPRLVAMDAGRATVLLLFRLGVSRMAMRRDFPWRGSPPDLPSGPTRDALLRQDRCAAFGLPPPLVLHKPTGESRGIARIPHQNRDRL